MVTRFCTGCGTEHPLTTNYWWKVESKPRCKTVGARTRKALYQRNKQVEISYQKKYKAEHPDKVRAWKRAWYRDNKESISLQQRESYKRNRDKIIARVCKYKSDREKIDPIFKLICRLRNRTYKVLRGILKSGSTVERLGCTPAELQQYVEAQFTAEMNWTNYGNVWELDHILPLANYDLSDRSTLRRLSHYTNLQPLLKAVNRQKSNREY